MGWENHPRPLGLWGVVGVTVFVYFNKMIRKGCRDHEAFINIIAVSIINDAAAGTQGGIIPS